jgi:hypothetical protein
LTTLKIAVFAPTPSASVTIAARVKPLMFAERASGEGQIVHAMPLRSNGEPQENRIRYRR